MENRPGQHLINHIALVLDASWSMQDLENAVIRTADDLVAFLATDSQEKRQETRVSIYSFGTTITCHVWDMDVLRLPTLKEHYAARREDTALIDATLLALDDGDLITEKYDDHAHMVYVITDGQENASKLGGERPGFGRLPYSFLAPKMKARLAGLKDNRTVAVLVPDEQGVRQAREFGFDNILIWDASTEAGLERAMATIKTATANYTTSRATQTGFRGTKSLFVGANVDAAAVKAAKLTPLTPKQRVITRVVKTDDSFEKPVKPVTKSRLKPEMGWFVKIEDFVKRINKGMYPLGDAFYELVKPESIQGDKEIAVVEVNTQQVFIGDGARQLLGLPAGKTRVKPDLNPNYTIFVQSNSLNRHLPHGCQVMLLKR